MTTPWKGYTDQEGRVLMCAAGGVSFGNLCLVSPVLMAVFLADNKKDFALAPKVVIDELTVTMAKTTTGDDRNQWVWENIVKPQSGIELYCAISNAWFRGDHMTQAIAPLPQADFINAVRERGIVILGDFKDYWGD